eukprot:5482965-Lingulodinium_polyedra.AAC.1
MAATTQQSSSTSPSLCSMAIMCLQSSFAAQSIGRPSGVAVTPELPLSTMCGTELESLHSNA